MNVSVSDDKRNSTSVKQQKFRNHTCIDIVHEDKFSLHG
jgi:hypothetical protein